MSKINLTDTLPSVVFKMSEGNPGAIMTMAEIIKHHDEIDPQAVFGGLGAIMMLDTWKIYGADIYVLFNDKCNRDIRQMLMLIRATQLGFFSSTKLQELAHDQMRKVNLTDKEFEELDEKVCNRLENFKRKK